MSISLPVTEEVVFICDFDPEKPSTNINGQPTFLVNQKDLKKQEEETIDFYYQRGYVVESVQVSENARTISYIFKKL